MTQGVNFLGSEGITGRGTQEEYWPLLPPLDLLQDPTPCAFDRNYLLPASLWVLSLETCGYGTDIDYEVTLSFHVISNMIIWQKYRNSQISKIVGSSHIFLPTFDRHINHGWFWLSACFSSCAIFCLMWRQASKSLAMGCHFLCVSMYMHLFPVFWKVKKTKQGLMLVGKL